MKIVLTGSVGNIGKPLTQQLVQKGHLVTVISSHPERQPAIETLGATAAIGSLEDVDFLAETFSGADVVYLMEAVDPAGYFDPGMDMINTYSNMARGYKQAVERAGVDKLIHLSSIGAHTTEGNGFLSMHYYTEHILNELPAHVSIKVMRPVGFFTNLYRFMQTIKAQGVIVSNYAGDAKEPWVSPIDIATTVTEAMEAPFVGRSVQYIASDEVSPNEIARALGEAIGKPDLQWIAIPDSDLLNGMISAGMNPHIAKGFIDMQAAQGTGALYEDYYANRPTLGKTKLYDFAKDFVTAFNQ